MIRRQELSDAEGDLLRPLLPTAATGRPRLDDRMVLNGIVWKFRTGVAWRDVPERYGSWATLHTRFRRWAKDGTFERMLQAAQAKADAAGDIDWVASVCRSRHRRLPGGPGRDTRVRNGRRPGACLRLALPRPRRRKPVQERGLPGSARGSVGER
ncbi:transposase [Streptomyces sp. NPDC015032]|uniref:transposase n=1 Tax=Streptomyces sp. NPDC015032 TaxID=3364937 RepID=UPI0037021612